MERPKMELELNKPVTITLLFDNCIEGTGAYGKYFLYAISNGDGKEYSLFSAESLHTQLKNYKKGDQLIITKQAAQKGNKVVVNFDVQKVPTNGKSNQEQSKQPTQPKADEDFYYSAMEKSFEEAIRLQTKYNGMANVNQIAVTLFIQRTKGNHSILN